LLFRDIGHVWVFFLALCEGRLRRALIKHLKICPLLLAELVPELIRIVAEADSQTILG
jgi:hypothetical protein